MLKKVNHFIKTHEVLDFFLNDFLVSYIKNPVVLGTVISIVVLTLFNLAAN